MLQLLSFIMVLCAFVALAQAMARHGKQIWGRALPDKAEQRRRLGGYLLLVLSLLALWLRLGPASAILLWCGFSSLAAVLVALTLSYRPHWLRWPGF